MMTLEDQMKTEFLCTLSVVPLKEMEKLLEEFSKMFQEEKESVEKRCIADICNVIHTIGILRFGDSWVCSSFGDRVKPILN